MDIGNNSTIRGLTRMIADVVGYEGRVEFDPNKPNGMPRKRLEMSRVLDFSWKAGVWILEGSLQAYSGFVGAAQE